MKNSLLFLVLFLIFQSCTPSKFDESKTPTLRLTFETNCSGMETGQAQINAMKKRIEDVPLEVVIQSFENKNNGKEIVVNVAQIADINTLRSILKANTKLAFRDVYRVDDAPMQALMQQISQDSLLMTKLALTQGHFQEGVLAQAAEEDRKNISEMLQKMDISKDMEFRWSSQPVDASTDISSPVLYQLFLIKKPKQENDLINNSNIQSATAAPSPYGTMEIRLDFDATGMTKFAQQTTAAAHDANRAIAILVNDEVMVAPRVNEPITAGRASISGDFTIEEAQLLASQLQFAALPCGDMTLIEETILTEK